MKKILLVVGLVFAGMVANAQFYAGGSLGFGMTSNKNDDGDKIDSETSFTINPEVGYSLSDRLDAGLTVGFGMTNYKVEATGAEDKTNHFRIAPYVRYSFVEFGSFKVMGKAELYFASGEEDEVKLTNFGLGITPVLGYSLSDHFILLANLNCFALGFDYLKAKDHGSSTTFGLGMDSNNVLNTGNFQIGFAYIF